MPKEAQIFVKAVRREKPDLRKLARVAIQLAIAEQAKNEDQSISDIPPPVEDAS